MNVRGPAPSFDTTREAVDELPRVIPEKSIWTALRSMYPPEAVTVPVNERLMKGMFPEVLGRLNVAATAPGFTSTPLAVRVNSIAADVRLKVTGIVKDAPAAKVAGTPEHEKTSRLVLHPFNVRAAVPAVHLTLTTFVRPATTEPNPAGLGVQVMGGLVDAPIP